MNTNATKVFVENNFAYDGISLYFLERSVDGKKMIAKSVEFVEMTEGEMPTPMIRLTRDNAQELIDNLWQCGFRPTEAMGSAGALAATQDHIKTLKEFAQRLLKLVEETPIGAYENRIAK